MLEGLDRLDWTLLRHAYGGASDVPGLIRDLASPDSVARDEALGRLSGSICHQGTVYEASSRAAPFLIELVEDPAVPDRVGILYLLHAIATGTSYLAVQESEPPTDNLPERTVQRTRELEWVRTAHAAVVEGVPVYLRHFQVVAEESAPELLGPNQGETLELLQAEHDNLRAALEWARENSDEFETGFNLAGHLWRFWVMRGFITEGRQRCAELLAAYLAAPASAALGRILHGAGCMAVVQGDTRAARSLFARAVEIRRSVGDIAGVAGSLGNLGTLAQRDGDLVGARRLFEESMALFQELGYEGNVANCLTCLGTTAHAQSDLVAAREFLTRALEIKRRLGDRAGEANVLNNLGIMERLSGDEDATHRSFLQALAINQELGYAWEEALNLINLGVHDRIVGEFENAAENLTLGIEKASDVGARAVIPTGLYELASRAGDEYGTGGCLRSLRRVGGRHHSVTSGPSTTTAGPGDLRQGGQDLQDDRPRRSDRTSGKPGRRTD